MEYLNFGWVIPGYLAGAQGPTSRRDLIFLRMRDVRAIIRMAEGTISGEELDIVDLYEDVPDFSPPSMEQLDRMVAFIEEQTETWERPVVVTCHAGQGRTGTVLACYLVHTGIEPQEAINHVRELRPRSLESHLQEEAVFQFAELETARRHRSFKRESEEPEGS